MGDDTINWEQIFAALQPASRLSLLMLIAAEPGKRHKELSLRSGLAGTCWHHLQVLVRAGLVTRDDVDKNDVRYYVNKPRVQQVIGLLSKLL
mgnify:CR=1 FL=1